MVVFLARRYAEVIEVSRGDDAPAHFVWRGRHYTVRSVLAHWIRTGAWWEMTGWESASWQQLAGERPASDTVDDDEREFWRVEASIGKSGHPVVAEVCFAWSTGIWTIASVHD